MTSPVQWETTVKTLLTKGLKKSYELGPGKVYISCTKDISDFRDRSLGSLVSPFLSLCLGHVSGYSWHCEENG